MPFLTMASLPGALRDLGSAQGRLAAFKHVTDAVFGPCHPGQAAHWRPRPYADTKSRWSGRAWGLHACSTVGGRRSAAAAACHKRHLCSCTCRYLWTDAFGVCNFITLAAETGEGRYLAQAEALIADVHGTLGWARNGKHRLRGATDEQPTRQEHTHASWAGGTRACPP